VEKSEEDLPTQCSAGRDGARPRHESEETLQPASQPAAALELPVGEFIEARYWKRFGGDPLDHHLHKPEPVSPKLLTRNRTWTR